MHSGGARFVCALIAQIVAEEAQRHGCEHVEDRVLLHEHRGCADEQRDDAHGKFHPRLLQLPAVEQAEHRSDRAENVYRRADVRVRVKGIEPADEPCQRVVARKHLGPQVLACREQQVNDHRYRVGADDKAHHPLKRRNVEEEGVHQCAYQVHEPKQIWYKEPFAEWYGVVKRAVHDVVRADVVKPLDEREHYAEQRPEYQQLDMPELVGIYFAQSKIPIIHLFSSELTLLLYIYIGARFGIMVETVRASRPSSASYVLRLPGSRVRRKPRLPRVTRVRC